MLAQLAALMMTAAAAYTSALARARVALARPLECRQPPGPTVAVSAHGRCTTRPTSEDTALPWHCGPLSAAAAPRPWWRLPCPTPWFRGPGIPTIAPSGLCLLAGQTSPAGPKRGLDGAHAAAVGITRRHHAQQHRQPPTRPPHHGQTTGDTPLRIRSIATAARRTARASSSGAVRGWTYAPDSIVAEFISNSAILTTIRPDSVFAIAPHTRPGATEMADLTAKSAIVVAGRPGKGGTYLER